MKLKAFAKINLSLRVFEKRADGYHNLESVMQSISLHDIVTLTPVSSGIEVVCSDPKVPQGKENIAYKAAELFYREAGSREAEKPKSGIRIEIEKHIPMAAGLAGGSADAAAVLFGLNQMSNDALRVTHSALLKIGSEIGSDVPFCLEGGTCLVKGRGEIVEKQEPWPHKYFVLVCPDLFVSAKWAYEEFDKLHLNLSEEIKNDLEPAVASKYEVIGKIKARLLNLGCGEAQMSGSGPSVFGTVRSRAEAEGIVSRIKEEYPRSYLVETAEKGIDKIDREK